MLEADDFSERLASFKSARYQELRAPQAMALSGYGRHVNDQDVAIELPTGYGKTLVALLIADLGMERGQTVAYLTGTNQLADQVRLQANDLPGLVTVKFSSRNYPSADLAAYHDARAIGVMNYWTYFNTSPKVEPADLVIFDDAHLAEQPLAGMFAIRVDRHSHPDLYRHLCDLVLSHTELYPQIELMRDGDAGPTTPPELLAFKHWEAISNSAAGLLAEGLPEEDAKFIFPRVRPNLPVCGVLIGPAAIEIRPYVPPSQTLQGYRAARQRLYLSATLGTMDDLQRRLGVAPVVAILDDAVAEDEVGVRLFLLNPGDDGPLDAEPFGFALQQAERSGRAAWLCASNAEADHVQELLTGTQLATYRLRGGGDDGVLEQWAADARGHLVTAGRYDGLDLAGELCRLVVIPSVPAASTEFERFVMAYLADATFMRHRVGQRITQALGRANRRSADWAMYLGLAPGFGTLLAQSAVRQSIPADVRPTIDAALERLEGGWTRARHEAREFWDSDGNAGRVTAGLQSGGRVRPGRTRSAATAGSAPSEVSAVTSLWLGDLAGASEAASNAATLLAAAGEAEHSAFWRYVQAQARYCEGGTPAVGRSIEALRVATEAGAITTWFTRLRRVLAELRGDQASEVSDQPWVTWDEWLQEVGAVGIRKAVDTCRHGLKGTHDQQCQAVEILGRMCGAVASRPTGQGVADGIWSWGRSRRVERRVWEVKTGVADRIPLDWINQVLGQIAAERPSARLRVVGCLVSDLEEVAPEAAKAGSELCLIRRAAMQELTERLGDRLIQYAVRSGAGTTPERGSAREAVEGRLPKGDWLNELLAPRAGAVISRDHVVDLFR